MQHYPLYALSVRNPNPNRELLYEGNEFAVLERTTTYNVRVYAQWDDELGNGSNSFHVRTGIYIANSDDESQRIYLSDVPEQEARIPQHVRALQKWDGCCSIGPWYYIENTVYLASNRDCDGLLEWEDRLTCMETHGLR